jgi:tRNA G10  N-methylase Trm11
MHQPSLFDNSDTDFPMQNNKQSGSNSEDNTPNNKEETDMIYSAYVCDNSFLFPRVLQLHVPNGAKVADVTYGKGIFWKNVDTNKYNLLKSDIKDETNEEDVRDGIDCRDLPYGDESMDAVVLDPPYKEGFYRENPAHKPDTGSHESFSQAYSNGSEVSTKYRGSSKWQQVVVDMYLNAGKEAHRILKDRGVLIVKCQDAVSANRNWMVHVDIMNAYEEFGFYAKDLFVMVRSNKPGSVNTQNQVHARKRHSYFLVFVKTPPTKDPRDMRSKSIN